MALDSNFFTLERVAVMINEDVKTLYMVSIEMDTEDGCVTIYDVTGEGRTAFSNFGIETLVNLLQEIRTQPGGLKEYLAMYQ